ncbi:MAG: Zn-ribbon domain-containing OB-fold protein [Bacillota bacterium]|nr:Zn-ribbon domain-containing OB-fold protein [Bacillota bacterium]
MAILERNTRNIDNRYWNPGVEYFPVKNKYTAGVAGQRFFDELKNNGKLYGTRCVKCNLTFVPARLFCERCFARLEEWIDVGLNGNLYSYTIVHKTKSNQIKKLPSLVAAIKIADGLIIHRLGECKPEDLWIGMPLIAKLLPLNERSGSILDIKYFTPFLE